MNAITVDEVYDAAVKLMGGASMNQGSRLKAHLVPSTALGARQGSRQEPSTFSLQPSAQRVSTLQRQRVLIIGPSNIGDAILASDVVAAVSQHFADAHLTLVVGERAKAVFVDDPRIHTLVDADAFTSLAGRLKLALALWRYHPHIVVDLRHTLYPVLLKPLRVWRYAFSPPKTLIHMRDRHLWKLSAQVPEIASSNTLHRSASRGARVNGAAVWLSAKDTLHIDGLWRRWNFTDSERLVIICPGARSHIKRWDTVGFARVADRLIREAGVRVVFCGEPEEEPIVESIRDLMGQPALSAVGLTTIRQLGALMQRAQLVITNDSASLHLASALQVPTLAIFGPTNATKYGPTVLPSRVIRRRLFCAPCEAPQCRFNHECMRFITPEEVWEAAKELLEGRRWKVEGGRAGAP